MATNYTAGMNPRVTAQSRPVPGKDQVMNNAGGYVFSVDIWSRLLRFLTIGTEAGTYYAGKERLTEENAQNVIGCIATDGRRVVDMAVEISQQGRAPKNDPAIFVMALAISRGDVITRQYVAAKLPLVCRTATHLFTFVHFVNEMRSWGRAVRRAVANWYSAKTPEQLAYQMVKYRSRTVEGTKNPWSHRDVLRQAHPRFAPAYQGLVAWTLGKGPLPDDYPLLGAVQELSGLEPKDASRAAELVATYGIPHEAWPTALHSCPEVWEAALPALGITALMRNLGRLSALGVIAPARFGTNELVAKRLADPVRIREGRLHPLNILVALSVYAKGRGDRGSLTWQPVREVSEVLQSAFYLSFKEIEPTGKRILLALDVSGSMDSSMIMNSAISTREATAALAMATARTETQWMVCGFSSTFVPIDIRPSDRLEDTLRKISGLPFAGTDCSLPMVWAEKNRHDFDAFVIYTDNETWVGGIHPFQALRSYRQQRGIDARLVVNAMTPTGFTIADPDDPGMLDVSGFDSATPQVISTFIRG